MTTCAPSVGSVRSSFLECLYAQCSLHSSEYIASSTRLGARPCLAHTSSYSARVSPSASASSTLGGASATAVDGGVRAVPQRTRALHREAHRLEDPQPVGGAADQLVDRVLGVGHQPEHVARLVAHAGDVVQRAVEVLARRVAQHDLAARLASPSSVCSGGVVAPPRVLGGDAQARRRARTRGERRCRASRDLELDLPEGEAQVGVGQQRARAAARASQQHLEAVADPQHEPAVAGERDHRLHRRREARDRARAQVVAVGEAARHDDRVGAAQVALAVPDQLGVADARGRAERVDLVAGARELQDAEASPGLRRRRRAARPRSPRRAGWRAASRTSARSCAGSSTSSSTRRPTCTLRHAREPERRQRALDRLALRVEDAGLRAGSARAPSRRARRRARARPRTARR